MKTIQIVITDFEEKILNHQLMNAEDWAKNALAGKINNIKKRLLKEAQEALFSDPDIESIPATEEGLLTLYFSRPYYVSRKDNDLNNEI